MAIRVVMAGATGWVGKALIPAITAQKDFILAGAVSRSAAAPYVATGSLTVLDLSLPPRDFTAIRHKERHTGIAVQKLLEIRVNAPDRYMRGASRK